MSGRVRLVGIILGVIVLAAAAAQAGEWQKLASKTVVFKSDSVEMKVKRDTPCSELKIKVSGKWIKAGEMKIVFADGTEQKVELGETIRPGMESQAIAVKDGPKAVAKVVLHYESGDGLASGRSKISVVGAS